MQGMLLDGCAVGGSSNSRRKACTIVIAVATADSL